MPVLFVTDELPRPGAAGHLALNHAIISWLQARGRKVIVLLTGARLPRLAQSYPHAPVAGPHVRQWGRRLFVTSPGMAGAILARRAARRLPAALAQKLRAARNGAEAVLGAFPASADIRWCARAVARLRPEAVLIDTMFRAPLLAEPELQGVRSIVIAHDVFHRRAAAMAAAGYTVQPRDLTRAREAALLGRASAIAAIQKDEAALLRQMCPQTHVFTAPMPALPCPPPPGAMRLPGRLVFVGSAALPNLDGLRWFLAEIWPLIGGHGITLDIIGECGSAMHRLPPGVQALGRVAELAPLLHRASLAIAPLRVGSGLKVKLLDYARHGLTTIVTPPALLGFETDGQTPFIVASSAMMFAEAVRRLAHNPPGTDGPLDYCRAHYSAEASFSGLAAVLRGRGGLPARPPLDAVGG